jgi:hypothetical protein
VQYPRVDGRLACRIRLENYVRGHQRLVGVIHTEGNGLEKQSPRPDHPSWRRGVSMSICEKATTLIFIDLEMVHHFINRNF